MATGKRTMDEWASVVVRKPERKLSSTLATMITQPNQLGASRGHHATPTITPSELASRGSGSRFQIVMPNLNMQLTGFDDVNVTAPNGSVSRRQVRAVDYVLKTIGVFL